MNIGESVFHKAYFVRNVKLNIMSITKRTGQGSSLSLPRYVKVAGICCQTDLDAQHKPGSSTYCRSKSDTFSIYTVYIKQTERV